MKVFEYPLEALREAVINAIAHRDYTESARVMIDVLRDKIVIRSPGLPMKPLTLDKIRTYNALPYRRNPRISMTFSFMGIMEERGSGLERMRDSLSKHGLLSPQFDIESGYFAVTFYGQEHALDSVRIAPDFLAKFRRDEQELLKFIVENVRITRAEYADRFKISQSSARRRLLKLTKDGIIEKRGTSRGTYYCFRGV